MSEHAQGHHPYYRIFALLTVFTIAEIGWAYVFHDARGLLVGGLGLMAAVKAALVGLYYMHLKYEGRFLWLVALFPIGLVVVLVAGFLPDAIAPY